MMCLVPLVAAVALAADPSQGLFLGIPPEPADPVLSAVAPPQCMFYMDWAGTRAPSPTSRSESEKLLAEPEVQQFLGALTKAIHSLLKKQDDEANKPDEVSDAGTTDPMPEHAELLRALQDAGETDLMLEHAELLRALQSPTAPSSPSDQVADVLKEAASGLGLSHQEMGELLHLLLTRPMAVFLADVRVVEANAAEAAADEKPGAGDWQGIEIEGGLVIALGANAAPWREKFGTLIEQAKKATPDSLERIEQANGISYRTKPTKPGGKIRATFGFEGDYFVVGVGEGALEGMLERWNGSPPPWLTKALAETEVPQRSGILYLNLKMIRDTFLPLAENPKQAQATLELFGLDNVDSIVATTGLEDDGMIGRTLLALDGKPRGLLDLVSDRPLATADLMPIPSNALLALAARCDLERSLKILLSALEKVAELNGPDSEEFERDMEEAVEELKKTSGIDINRILSAVGDTWCVYNSPAEGHIPFFGWTAVVSVRDRAALVENWEKVCVLSAKRKEDKKDVGGAEEDSNSLSFEYPLEFRKFRYAGHELYYVAGQAIAPAFCVLDREMVMTLNMPAMKAYLARKGHRSLAKLPHVASALQDGKGTVGLWYCDTPRLFDFFYPMISLYGTAAGGLAQRAQIDLDPTYWPSAPPIRAHLRPDVGTVERTPAGLMVTNRYNLPSSGADALMWLIGLSAFGQSTDTPSVPEMLLNANQLDEPATDATPLWKEIPQAPLTPEPNSTTPTSPVQ